MPPTLHGCLSVCLSSQGLILPCALCGAMTRKHKAGRARGIRWLETELRPSRCRRNGQSVVGGRRLKLKPGPKAKIVYPKVFSCKNAIKREDGDPAINSNKLLAGSPSSRLIGLCSLLAAKPNQT
jgi:hypothetical protein